MSEKVNPEDLKNKFEKEFDKLKNSIKKPNILVLGQTGVGKSSLLNSIFGQETAKVSNVKPETRGFHKFTSENSPINIIDSEGYELGNSEKFKDALNEYIGDNVANVNEQIHIAWYCISISGARVLPFDLENIKFLTDEKKIPTAVVFTQCDLDDPQGGTAKAMGQVITNEFSNLVNFFQVSHDEELNKKDLDVDNLVDWSINNISDENIKLAFIIGQKVSLKLKRDKAKLAIAGYGVSAAGIGAVPIPGADAPLLIALQTAMAANIFHIYGLNFGVAGVFKNVIGSRMISMMGKLAASNIIKFFPGIGTVVGGMINATVASTITISMGYALITMSEKIIESQLNGTFNEDVLNNILSSEFLEGAIKKYEESKK